METGYLFIMSGPSGVGKGSLRKEIMRLKDFDLVYSISMTTRPQRAYEQEGIDYYFVTQEQFQQNLDSGNFLEHAEFVGNFYGTPKDKIEELRKTHNVFVEIDTQGVSQIIKQYKDDPKVITFFIFPPSLEELEKRIRGRSTETEETIQNRLKKAKQEYKVSGQYTYRVINENLMETAQIITALMRQSMNNNFKVVDCYTSEELTNKGYILAEYLPENSIIHHYIVGLTDSTRYDKETGCIEFYAHEILKKYN